MFLSISVIKSSLKILRFLLGETIFFFTIVAVPFLYFTQLEESNQASLAVTLGSDALAQSCGVWVASATSRFESKHCFHLTF